MCCARSWWTAVVAAFCTLASFAQTDDAWIRGIYVGESPHPVPTNPVTAWQQATALAARTPGAFVLEGKGESMRPLYPPGTVLVLQVQGFGALHRGQTVLYRNSRQKVVAHVLTHRVRDGWRAQGLNNAVHDMEPIQAENVIGVVIAAYLPTAPDGVGLAGMN